MKKTYQIRKRDSKGAANAVARFAEANGQFLLPMVELVEESRIAMDEVIQQISRQTIETVLRLRAEQVAGGRTPGKAKGEIRLYGSQPGSVKLADRDVPVKRPRLRRKQGGEEPVPAYEAMRKNPAQAAQMLGTILHGVSTREYQQVLPKAAEAVGVSRSTVSRQMIEASEKKLRELAERRWDNAQILILYIDGQRFGEHHILGAVGVDATGKKHIWGSNTAPPRTRRRSAEIGTLRVLVLSKLDSFTSFLLEYLLLSLLGGLLGCLQVLPLNNFQTGIGSFVTFSEITFSFQVTSSIMAAGMAFVRFMGAIGGLFPAASAARNEILVALKQNEASNRNHGERTP